MSFGPSWKAKALRAEFSGSATLPKRSVSPFGDLQIYASSYMHFAPGLSDNAAFNLPEVPSNAYVGMYIDGDGPEGIMKNLPDKDTAYFRFLPMYYPYVINPAPTAFAEYVSRALPRHAIRTVPAC